MPDTAVQRAVMSAVADNPRVHADEIAVEVLDDCGEIVLTVSADVADRVTDAVGRDAIMGGDGITVRVTGTDVVLSGAVTSMAHRDAAPAAAAAVPSVATVHGDLTGPDGRVRLMFARPGFPRPVRLPGERTPPRASRTDADRFGAADAAAQLAERLARVEPHAPSIADDGRVLSTPPPASARDRTRAGPGDAGGLRRAREALDAVVVATPGASPRGSTPHHRVGDRPALSKSPRGWVLGYNAQAVVTGAQIIVAAEVDTDSIDRANLQPMVHTACEELRAAGVDGTPGAVIADAGYWRTEAIEAHVAQGIQTLVAPDADRRKDPSSNRRGGLYELMRRVLAADDGSQLYARRQAIIEPVFGQIKHNRGAERFQRRGRSAARSEWRLLAATHNILKLWRHNTAAITA